MTVEVGCVVGGGGNITIGADFGDGTPTVNLTVGTVSLSAATTDYPGDRDTWWPDVALCPDDANKNGTNIHVDGVVASRSRGIAGWDLSSYPTGATVTAATVRIVVQSPPLGLVNGNDRCRLITAATEGWDEANVRCSNHPADDGEAAAGFVVTSAGNGGAQGDVYVLTLNATARTRIQNRMGVGTFSLIFDSNDTTTLAHDFYDKENGSSAQRPLLTFSWNKTL